MTVYVPAIIETDLKKIIRSLRELARGRSNSNGTVTLRASQTTTTVVDDNCAAGTVPFLVPTTANAAAALSGIYVPLATVVNGSFVIQHANTATVDRTFMYAFCG